MDLVEGVSGDHDLGLARSRLFAAVETKENWLQLVRLFEPSNDEDFIAKTKESQRALIAQIISAFHHGHAQRFFSGLNDTIAFVIEKQALCQQEQHTEGDESFLRQVKPDDFYSFLRCSAEALIFYVEGRIDKTRGQKKVQSNELIFRSSLQLHNVLFTLEGHGEWAIAAQNQVLHLCEMWWHSNGVHRELLVTQCLPLLALRALDGGAMNKKYLGRLYKMNDALEIIDFENSSSDSLRSLLLRVVSNPLCIRTADGKNFISGLLCSDSMLEDVHGAIRAQIPDARVSVLEAYGEIYLKAWKALSASDHEQLRVLENEVVQDLAYAVFHVKSSKMMASLLCVLQPFYRAKKNPSVEHLLCRTHGPLLWRSLKAANPQVRSHAYKVLSAVFPLNDEPNQNARRSIEAATNALSNGMKDEEPSVRVASSEAACSILSTYWTVIPSNVIRSLLNVIVLEHASDATSAAVRSRAVSTVSSLLSVSPAQAVLRPLLPSLGNLIHDKAESVRLAVVKLLEQVKNVKGIRFYHVVPVHHLTARLSEESKIHGCRKTAITSSITSLLMRSFFPKNKTAADHLQRSLAFIEKNSSSAVVFFSNVNDHVSTSETVKIFGMLLAYVKSIFPPDFLARRQTQVDDQGRTEPNPRLMSTIVGCMEVLWKSIQENHSRLRENEQRLNLTELFRGAHLFHLVECADHMASVCTDEIDRSNWESMSFGLLECAGALDSSVREKAAEMCTAKMITGTYTDRTKVKIAALLCCWGKVPKVVGYIQESLSAPFVEDSVRVSFAQNIVQDIFSGSVPSFCIAREAIIASSVFENLLENMQASATNFLSLLVNDDIDAADTLTLSRGVWVCENYARCSIHAIFHPPPRRELNSLLTWMSGFVTHFCNKLPSTGKLEGLDISKISQSSDSLLVDVESDVLMNGTEDQTSSVRKTGSERLCASLIRSFILAADECIHISDGSPRIVEDVSEVATSWYASLHSSGVFELLYCSKLLQPAIMQLSFRLFALGNRNLVSSVLASKVTAFEEFQNVVCIRPLVSKLVPSGQSREFVRLLVDIMKIVADSFPNQRNAGLKIWESHGGSLVACLEGAMEHAAVRPLLVRDMWEILVKTHEMTSMASLVVRALGMAASKTSQGFLEELVDLNEFSHEGRDKELSQLVKLLVPAH